MAAVLWYGRAPEAWLSASSSSEFMHAVFRNFVCKTLAQLFFATNSCAQMSLRLI